MQDPWSWTLRELTWRKDALQEQAWEYVAWLCAHQPWGKAVTVNMFNPLREKMLDIEDGVASMSEARAALKDFPATLTNEERERRWQAWCLRNPA